MNGEGQGERTLCSDGERPWGPAPEIRAGGPRILSDNAAHQRVEPRRRKDSPSCWCSGGWYSDRRVVGV